MKENIVSIIAWHQRAFPDMDKDEAHKNVLRFFRELSREASEEAMAAWIIAMVITLRYGEVYSLLRYSLPFEELRKDTKDMIDATMKKWRERNQFYA